MTKKLLITLWEEAALVIGLFTMSVLFIITAAIDSDNILFILQYIGWYNTPSLSNTGYFIIWLVVLLIELIVYNTLLYLALLRNNYLAIMAMMFLVVLAPLSQSFSNITFILFPGVYEHQHTLFEAYRHLRLVSLIPNPILLVSIIVVYIFVIRKIRARQRRT